jgi:hypothetical protein
MGQRSSFCDIFTGTGVLEAETTRFKQAVWRRVTGSIVCTFENLLSFSTTISNWCCSHYYFITILALYEVSLSSTTVLSDKAISIRYCSKHP